MFTIKDVAKKSGVSISTVSAVINNTKYVSEELTVKVEQAIQELNYRPNQAARQLKHKRTKIVGVLIPELTNIFFTELLNGVEKHSTQNEYQIFLSMTYDIEEKEIKAINSMLDYGVDGFLLSTIDDNNSAALEIIKKSNVPYVFLNRSPRDAESHVIQLDNFKVGELAALYAIENKFEKIIFLGRNRFNSLEREKAFKQVLFENRFSVENTIYCEYKIEDAREKINQYLKYNEAPNFIYAASDVQAYGAIIALLENGYKVPEDVRILGTDNNNLSKYFKVPVSTIDGKASTIGFNGATILWDILSSDGINQELIKELIEPKLIIRES